MYRIVCESYENYIKDFQPHNIDNYRYKIMEPFKLLVDIEMYKREKEKDSFKYREIEDFVYYAKESIDEYPNTKSFLWSLESRGIYGKNYNVLKEVDFKEIMKILNMFLKLSYWN